MRLPRCLPSRGVPGCGSISGPYLRESTTSTCAFSGRFRRSCGVRLRGLRWVMGFFIYGASAMVRPVRGCGSPGGLFGCLFQRSRSRLGLGLFGCGWCGGGSRSRAVVKGRRLRRGPRFPRGTGAALRGGRVVAGRWRLSRWGSFPSVPSAALRVQRRTSGVKSAPLRWGCELRFRSART